LQRLPKFTSTREWWIQTLNCDDRHAAGGDMSANYPLFRVYLKEALRIIQERKGP
jgi:hypothetical protein